jgi:hypothetical protein
LQVLISGMEMLQLPERKFDYAIRKRVKRDNKVEG